MAHIVAHCGSVWSAVAASLPNIPGPVSDETIRSLVPADYDTAFRLAVRLGTPNLVRDLARRYVGKTDNLFACAEDAIDEGIDETAAVLMPYVLDRGISGRYLGELLGRAVTSGCVSTVRNALLATEDLDATCVYENLYPQNPGVDWKHDFLLDTSDAQREALAIALSDPRIAEERVRNHKCYVLSAAAGLRSLFESCLQTYSATRLYTHLFRNILSIIVFFEYESLLATLMEFFYEHIAKYPGNLREMRHIASPHDLILAKIADRDMVATWLHLIQFMPMENRFAKVFAEQGALKCLCSSVCRRTSPVDQLDFESIANIAVRTLMRDRDVQAVRTLHLNYPKHDTSVFLAACSYGFAEAVDMFLDMPQDRLSYDTSDAVHTALALAITHGHPRVVSAIFRHSSAAPPHLVLNRDADG